MTDEEFNRVIENLSEYLKAEKIFIKDPSRWNQFMQSYQIACELFSDAKVEIENDPLQMGAMILRISSLDIVVRGEQEINSFKALIKDADNFEIYAENESSIRFAAVFQNVLTRIG